MSDETSAAPSGGEVTTPAPAPAPSAPESFSARDAAEAIARRQRGEQPEARPPQPRDPETQRFAQRETQPDTASASEAEAAPEPPVAAEDGPEPTARRWSLPSSWTQEQRDQFHSLPEELQRTFADGLEKQQNEYRQYEAQLAERSKAIQAQAAEAQRARQQYEYAVAQALQSLQAQNANEFADIKTWDDVQRLAREDVIRYAAWNAHQQKLRAAQEAHQQAQARTQAEQTQRWQAFVQDQDAKFINKVPEAKDPEKAARLMKQAKEYLNAKGYTDQELGQQYNSNPWFRDARWQEIVHDALRFQAAKAKLENQPPKPVPQVQKPGTTASRTDSATAEIRTLDKTLSQTGSIKDAARLLAAKMADQRRRAS